MEMELLKLSPKEIVRSPLNPRKRFSSEGMEELVDSVRSHGVLQTVGIRPRKKGKGYELIWGERRWRAATMVMEGGDGNDPVPDLLIPATMKDMSDAEVFDLQVLENLQRESLTVTEEAAAYAKAMEFGCTEADVARKFHRDRSRVSRYIRLLDLPNGVLSRLDRSTDDPDYLPAYVALESVKVPAEMDNGQARLRALQMAEEAGSVVKARAVIEDRFLRPYREQRQWEEMDVQGMGDVVMGYHESRRIFPPRVTTLTPITSDGYVFAEDHPDESLLGAAGDRAKSWGDYAEVYGVERLVVCDGAMQPRVLVSRDAVLESALVAHQFVCRQEGERVVCEGDYAMEGGARMVFWAPVAGEWIPYPLREGVEYRVSAQGLVYDMEGEAKPLQVSAEGAGAPFYGVDLDGCVFRPQFSRKGAARPAPQQEVSPGEESQDAAPAPEMDVDARAELAAKMLGDLETAVREAVESGAGSDEFLARCGADLVELALAGFSGNDNPYMQLLLALDKPEPEGKLMAGWDGFETRVGYESATVCAWVLYWLNLHDEGDDLENCAAWRLALEVYG